MFQGQLALAAVRLAAAGSGAVAVAAVAVAAVRLAAAGSGWQQCGRGWQVLAQRRGTAEGLWQALRVLWAAGRPRGPRSVRMVPVYVDICVPPRRHPAHKGGVRREGGQVPGPELRSEGRGGGGRREVTPSPRVLALAPPVVGPAVIVALTRLTAAGTVSVPVVFCLTWLTCLLLDQKARPYFQPSQRFLVANLSSSLVAGLQGALDPDCASLHLTSCYQA